MIGYIGAPGALQALPYRGGLDTSSDRPVSFVRTLGGKRKAFYGRASRREWGVSFDLVGSRDVAGLVAVSQTMGPHLWYPADAASGNLLSPQASGFTVAPTNAVDAGLVALPDGSVARSVSDTGGGMNVGGSPSGYETVPVLPGQVLTLGAWGFNGVRITGAWRDAAGANIGGFVSTAQTFSGWRFHSMTTGVAPAGAVAAQMILTTGAQYARPSIAWGSVAKDRPGRGCPKAVVHGLSEALAVIRPDDAYGSIDVTVTEVG